MRAAEAAFQSFQSRPVADRAKAVECIRSICVNQAEELGRLELEETKIGRLDHKIAKLQNAIAVVPGVEYLRTDNDSGDDGLTLTDYVPFGVIGAITPVTHSLPTLAGNAINMLAAGNTVVFNAHPSGADRCGGAAKIQQGDSGSDRHRKPADDHRPAHNRVGRRVIRPQGGAAAGGHGRAGGGTGGTGEQEAGDRGRAG